MAGPFLRAAAIVLLSGAPGAAIAAPGSGFDVTAGGAVAHGARLGRVLGCAGCHGADLTGKDAGEPGFMRLWSANLTRSATRYTPAQLAAIIRTGRRPGGRVLWEMPSFLFTGLSAGEMAAIVAWIRSHKPTGPRHAEPVFEAGARQEIAAGLFHSAAAEVAAKGRNWPPDAGPAHARARYIVRATCAECHGMDLHGGTPYPGATPRPDLRIVAAYPAGDFARLLRTGIATGGREIGLMSQVARSRYRHLSNDEVAAIRAYLTAVAKHG
jgi:cytochrome c553